MIQATILANAKIVLPGEVISGAIVLQDGVIAEVQPGRAVPVGAVDCHGDYLCPGLIELHTDNLERHLAPRPKVNWPHGPAIIAHDREMAATGITTVFDAIRVGSILSDGGQRRLGKYARGIADEILQLRAAGALSICHHLHLRAEVCSETLVAELAEFGPEDRVGIVSLMDHTPGQRQFRDIGKFEDYVCNKNGLPREGFDAYVAFLYGLQERLGRDHEKATVAAAARMEATLASHDDTTAAHVETSKSYGISLAEFPTSVEAARACATHGIRTIMGAPNLVRGGSHSGNVSAAELASLDLVDIMSSDYVPAALLYSATLLARLWDDLPRAIATVTRTPAHSVGLTDRGEIGTGKRADVLRFSLLDDLPVLRGVWAAGQKLG